MKTHTITLCILASFLPFAAYSQLQGKAYLSNSTNHALIKVKFTSNGGTAVSDSVLTDSKGSYSLNIAPGAYKVNFSRAGYLDRDHNNNAVVILTNTVVVSSYTLIPGNAVPVTGSVSGIWYKKNTYIVNENIIVPLGKTLTIEPGTQVRVNGPFSIISKGVLIASGSSSEPILFTSHHYSPGPGIWADITLSNNASIMKHCIIEYHNWGVRLDNCSPIFENNEIRHFARYGVIGFNSATHVKNNKLHSFASTAEGITMVNAGVVECNEIYDAEGSGISNSGAVLIKGNEMRGLWRGMNVSNDGIIQNNYIHDCTEGLHMLASTATVANNCLLNITRFGITTHADKVRIVNNLIVGCNAGIIETNCFNCTHSNIIENNNLWNNPAGNYTVTTPGIGQTVTVNAQGVPIDSYFNMSMDPKFSVVPALAPTSPCLKGGNTKYYTHIGLNISENCFTNPNLVGDLELHHDIVTFYPNPTNGMVTVSINEQCESLSFTCVNEMGKLIFENRQIKCVEQLDLSNISPGIYFVTIQKDGAVLVRKKLVKL